MTDPNLFGGIVYRQTLDSCVLASYASACHAFSKNKLPVLDYFLAYCRHFNLDQTHPERSYEAHFHPLAQTKPGYQIIGELHEQSNDAVFVAARSSIALDPVGNWANNLAKVAAAIRQPDCLLLLFVNSKPNGNRWMYSIVVGHDGAGLYYFDTSPGALQKGPSKIQEFGDLGDAFLVKKR